MDHNTPTVLSLCSGAGGLELGLKLAVPGSRTVCYVEGEAYAAAQLAARMEDETMDAAPVWSDVKTFDPEPWRGCVDIITAGYPCQPFSIAGAKRAEKDPRHLWPYIREIVRTIEPRVCFFENVSHHLRFARVGCMPCIMARKMDVREMAKRFPEHVERILEWESLVSGASKRGRSTFFSSDKMPCASNYDPEKDGYQGIDEVVRWAETDRGGRQLNLFTSSEELPSCASVYRLCE